MIRLFILPSGLFLFLFWFLYVHNYQNWPITSRAIRHLFTGWFTFASRVAGEMTINWSAVAGAAVLLAAFGCGLHALLRSLDRARPKTDDAPGRPPSRRRTAAIVGVVVVLFAMGTAAVGAIHQVTWLTSGREPVTTRRERPSAVAWDLWYAVERAQFRTAGVRGELPYMDVEYADRFHLLFLTGPDGKIAAVAIVHRLASRDPSERVWVCCSGDRTEAFPIEGLPRFIAEVTGRKQGE